MGTVPITINGVVFPKGRSGTDQPVPCTIVGQAWISDLSVGGGPVYPPDQPPSGGPPGQPIHPIWGPPGFNPPGPGMPPGIWGGPIVPPQQPPGSPGSPQHPIWGPPGFNPPGPGMPPGIWGGPIIPPDLPPGVIVPTPPNPGDPVTPVQPPPGSGGWPVQPITPPPFIIVNYPGVGPVVVPPPANNATSPSKSG